MLRISLRRVVALIAAISLATSTAGDSRAQDLQDEISFSRDVLPVLSDRCFQCHGPDEADREAELRLDEPIGWIGDDAEVAVVVPGNVPASRLWQRITSADDDLRMPPVDSHRQPLSPSELEAIKGWIESGASWDVHWSFRAPRRPPVPRLASHPVDAFVRRQLIERELEFSSPAEPHTLIRRLAFDLTGLPPTEKVRRAFCSSPTEDTYRQLVERLLQSPHFGERMAMWWLDAARYADTDGYQQDATRSNWPWRDWVVEAFNRNQPFDQFTIDQFAGDLLPPGNPAQVLATCFHRNHMTNGEGGRDPEESRVDYVIDRVNTVGTVWLGLTVGCAQCHSHKFDPISQADYYRLSAFFNSIDEDGRAGSAAKPFLEYTSRDANRSLRESRQLVERLEPEVAAARDRAIPQFERWLAKQIRDLQASYQPWRVLDPTDVRSTDGTEFSRAKEGIIQTCGPLPRQDDYRVIATSPVSRVTGLQLEVFPNAQHVNGRFARDGNGEFILTDVKLHVRQRGKSLLRDVELAAAVADAEVPAEGRAYGRVRDTLDDDPRNGWTTPDRAAPAPHRAVFALAEPLDLAPDEQLVFVMLHRSTVGHANLGRFRLSVTDQPGEAVRSLDPMPIEELAKLPSTARENLSNDLRDRLFAQFLESDTNYQDARHRLHVARTQLREAESAAKPQKVMVLAERAEARPTYILERGVWDQHGDQVERGFPSAILPWDSGAQPTRLDLAHWLMSRDNPLTARVVVNQLWQLFFGVGLVRTPEDFGLQGERPTHPELLDWLAVELQDHHWDLRHIIRLIVTSQTYQQRSTMSPAMLLDDPENRYFARAARFRLPSWMIRDMNLAVAGLLNRDVGGPPVRPFQPEGVWAEIFMGRFRYEPSLGNDQYRRTLYAFWRRSSAPTFLFDSSQRRVCEVRVRETNTPLHALTLMNNRTHWAAASRLGELACQSAETPLAQIEWIFQRILGRRPTDDESQVLLQVHADTLQAYANLPGEAIKLDTRPASASLAAPFTKHTAAMAIVASTILNLDEAITHE